MIEHLFERPDQFLLGFDGSQAVFVRMDRDAYHRTLFCDQRISPVDRQLTKIECSELFDLCSTEGNEPRRLSYIFHIAHCGSTLLARALDIKDANIVYREPMALRQIGVDYATNFFGGAAPDDWRQRLHLVTSLLGRSYHRNAPIIIKGNVPVNFIIPQLLAPNPDSKAILLYFSLENYLLAVLRTPEHRQWVMFVTSQLKKGLRATTENDEELSAPLAAARLWLAQVSIFSDVIANNRHVKSLDADVLFNDPRRVIDKAFEFFGQECSTAKLTEIIDSDLFTRNSKNPARQFTNEQRLERQERLKNELADDLDEARNWIEQRQPVCSISQGLPNALA